MKDTQNITIVLLLVTAAILTAALIANYFAQEARADVAVHRNNFILVAGEIGQDRDLVYVIDVRSKKLVAYDIDRDKRAVTVFERIDLGKAFGD